MRKKIAVLGLGFVGLTTALGFADKGNLVYGYDINESKRECLMNGKIFFQEPMLEEVLNKYLGKNFIISQDLTDVIKNSEYIFICVGTPVSVDGGADLSYVFQVLDRIMEYNKDEEHRVIVIKSTIPPSTTTKNIMPYIEEKKVFLKSKFSIVTNPEFLREGKCWEDFVFADRIVCGLEDDLSENKMRELYEDFCADFFSVSYNTAEFIKYLSNVMLATMISFSNEMAIIADYIGEIDIKKAFKIVHKDKRWNECNMKEYVYPGCGYGGYCLPKDTKALLHKSLQFGYNPQILGNVIQVNEDISYYITDKIIRSTTKTSRITILGLSFKPESDDVRNSPAKKIIEGLIEKKRLNICAYDPVATENFKKNFNFDFVKYHDNLAESCESAEYIVIVTAWEEFKAIDKLYPYAKVFDLRYAL